MAYDKELVRTRKEKVGGATQIEESDRKTSQHDQT